MSLAKPDQSFRIEDLLKGKISKDQFQIDYLPMFQMLDNWDRKHQATGGLASIKTEDIWKRIYDFGIITVSLDKSDMQTRIDDLNAQNLKYFTKADTLELENTQLKARIAELEKLQTSEPLQGIQIRTSEGISLPEEANEEVKSDT